MVLEDMLIIHKDLIRRVPIAIGTQRKQELRKKISPELCVS